MLGTSNIWWGIKLPADEGAYDVVSPSRILTDIGWGLLVMSGFSCRNHHDNIVCTVAFWAWHQHSYDSFQLYGQSQTGVLAVSLAIVPVGLLIL